MAVRLDLRIVRSVFLAEEIRMGYRGREDWRDMSDFVVHFTRSPSGSGLERSGGYDSWIKILGGRELRAGPTPFGAAKNIPELSHLNRCVCFSEIPLDMLERLVERRSRYGIGFKKDFLVERGGAPLWYLDRVGPQADLIREEISRRVEDGIDIDDPFWRITPFIDQPGVYGNSSYRFEWEREWRIVGNLQFELDDVAFLFLPEGEHDKARQFFVDAKFSNTGPAYLCPYVDSNWNMDEIQDALKVIPSSPDPSPSTIPWF